MKILISPDYGAGWSTWAWGGREAKKFVMTYQPIIDFIEQGNDPSTINENSEIGKQFLKDFKKATGNSYFYFGGAKNLEVVDVDPPFSVQEYDGNEYIVNHNDFDF